MAAVSASTVSAALGPVAARQRATTQVRVGNSRAVASRSPSFSSSACFLRVTGYLSLRTDGQTDGWMQGRNCSISRALTSSGKVGRLETRVEGYTHYCVTASVSTEKDAPVRREFLQVEGVCFRPPGTQFDLLDKVSMSLPEKSLGLVYGPSGSGKTTLLQVLSGLVTPTEGSIHLGRDGSDLSKRLSGPLSLSARVGIVFQFPERYFLTDSIVEELLFGYSRQTPDLQLRHTLTLRLQTALVAVGLSGMPLDMNPRALSDGYKRRLALAVQLVRMPDVMLLDEPLAGLDWRARADVVRLLSAIKKEKTLIVVSHDLKELSGLVDKSWRMEMGGKLTEQPLEKSQGGRS